MRAEFLSYVHYVIKADQIGTGGEGSMPWANICTFQYGYFHVLKVYIYMDTFLSSLFLQLLASFIQKEKNDHIWEEMNESAIHIVGNVPSVATKLFYSYGNILCILGLYRAVLSLSLYLGFQYTWLPTELWQWSSCLSLSVSLTLYPCVADCLENSDSVSPCLCPSISFWLATRTNIPKFLMQCIFVYLFIYN